MQRLTKREHDRVVFTWGTFNHYNNNDIQEVMNKLAVYEDAEEQGRLVALPDSINDGIKSTIHDVIEKIDSQGADGLIFLLL